ncbi:MAG: UDP-N-acetylmuramoyl-tripeptide--D-alanyl-D-alanine ligase [Trichodesmium sp. St16_bin4-tuft]|nr:UDP-N-acetylmuramoyl-tripeptide--D-alanyl-D-alanine ligase [Trichodesmium sp. St5_bin8]MDE5078513.1 UDP-N-acetylmuramoyl-tripeptide--D-alanyl-D-alanine ligase [Trichodesmium sp. St2_bin6]MDE5090403.1 UDP-N-acetylmuramoyl-tripeptide--D-alanyl-D-alanine ligase [Trichodesmium sp. St18_bin3_1_1]MDE5100711.1 UDP-N-acetylmuramoyl-tripeptide--D-alanyl-D-alanine ligase [Trichodesmium sp. St16_bin4-tuft]MDE5103331.1 UDP-N-acetylmuramoyl-tripeptide--D-alanyl-D-alanine ligase [Trichodesmium sp. St19_bi
MVCCMTLFQLTEILTTTTLTGFHTPEKTLITSINTDTRNLQPGEGFLALRGNNFDGHNFVDEAIEKGASCVIVEQEYTLNSEIQQLSNNIPILQVENTLKAYQKIARWWRDRFDIPVISVTGSIGKTTTKELIAEVLATQGKVMKTEANYNNEIGVAKTLLRLSDKDNYAVVEMAMRGPGEIAELTHIANPTIGLITNVGTAHIGRLGSVEAIAEAKCELLREMSDSSIAILNYDNQRLIETAAKVWSGETFTYGLEGGNLQGKLIDSQTINVEGVDLPLPLPGSHNASNYLAALAVLKVLHGKNIPAKTLFQSLTNNLFVQLPGSRARKYDLENDIVILDESYNAGLESMIAALNLLAETPGKRHIAVLGTMKELGDKSILFHQQVGNIVKNLNIDALFILADFEEAKAMTTGAASLQFIKVENITADDAHHNLAKYLQEFLQPGDRVLFKASHSVELNKVVELLIN